jgi:hypothetical protein
VCHGSPADLPQQPVLGHVFSSQTMSEKLRDIALVSPTCHLASQSCQNIIIIIIKAA